MLLGVCEVLSGGRVMKAGAEQSISSSLLGGIKRSMARPP